MCASNERRAPHRPAQQPPRRGLTLIELVVAITLIGVAATALLNTFGTLAQRSADPLVQRQALAVAESMLAEALAQGTGSTDQSGVANGMGPEPGESRSGGGMPFDNVDDYDGLVMAGVRSLDGTHVAGLEAYTVRVSVSQQALSGVPQAQGLWVLVRVSGPGGHEVQLQGWRARLDP